MERRNFSKTTGLSAAAIGLAESGWAKETTTVKSPKRPLCAFTKCLQFLTIEEVAQAMAKNGFDGADLLVRPAGQIEPKNVKTELLQAVKTFQKLDVQIPMMPPFLHAPAAGQKFGLEIRIYGSKTGSYRLYDDDGETFDYEKRTCSWRALSVASDKKGKLVGNHF